MSQQPLQRSQSAPQPIASLTTEEKESGKLQSLARSMSHEQVDKPKMQRHLRPLLEGRGWPEALNLLTFLPRREDWEWLREEGGDAGDSKAGTLGMKWAMDEDDGGLLSPYRLDAVDEQSLYERHCRRRAVRGNTAGEAGKGMW